MSNPNDIIRDEILRYLYHLHRTARGPRAVGTRIRERTWRYDFSNPSFLHQVIEVGIDSGLANPEFLHGLVYYSKWHDSAK